LAQPGAVHLAQQELLQKQILRRSFLKNQLRIKGGKGGRVPALKTQTLAQ